MLTWMRQLKLRNTEEFTLVEMKTLGLPTFLRSFNIPSGELHFAYASVLCNIEIQVAYRSGDE